MSEYKNKYFEQLNYKTSCTENLFYKIGNDRRQEQWKVERSEYGGYDERVTWALDAYMTEQIYTWLKMYYDNASIDLTFYKFTVDGKELTQGELLSHILEDLEFYLFHMDDFDIEIWEEVKHKSEEAYKLLGIILPSLWW